MRKGGDRIGVGIGLVVALAAAVAAGTLPKLPKDYAFLQSADSPGVVTFSHASHVDVAKPDCIACHPRLFRILQKGTPASGLRVRHAEIEAGRQCGACHDGKAASGLDDCAACHEAQDAIRQSTVHRLEALRKEGGS